MLVIKCIIFGHDWKDWVFVKPIGRYENKLMRNCNKCGKKETYTGLTTKKNKTYEPRH